MKADFLLKHAAQLATPEASVGFSPGKFLCIEDGAVAAYHGEIVAVGTTSEVVEAVELSDAAVVVNAEGRTVTPGFVDAHTHPIFWGTREDEFEMRLEGRSYEKIARAGGGILSSVRSVRQASKDGLVEAVLPRLDRFLAHGTTTVEAKSGYGLSVEDEVKSLEVIAELNRQHPVELIPTFLGAHEIPEEYRARRDAYIDLVIDDMIPRVAEGRLAEFCDVFCESHVFTVAESRRILEAARASGLKLKVHADQLTANGGAILAADLGAVSADHLEQTDEADWRQLLDRRVVPVMLPGAVFFLGKGKYAQAREMWDLGLPVALATDFNPGTCMSESMPMMMTLACLMMRLTPREALTAATWHGALAVDRGNSLGCLAVGREADLVVWGAPSYQHLAYHFGVNLVHTVIKGGRVVYENGEIVAGWQDGE